MTYGHFHVYVVLNFTRASGVFSATTLRMPVPPRPHRIMFREKNRPFEIFFSRTLERDIFKYQF